MKITNSVEKNGSPQLIQDCNASTIKEILERVLHSITGKFDCAGLVTTPFLIDGLIFHTINGSPGSEKVHALVNYQRAILLCMIKHEMIIRWTVTVFERAAAIAGIS